MRITVNSLRRGMTATLLTGAALLLTQGAWAQSTYAPLTSSSNFKLIAPQGFGDLQNSWAWSMAWFNGKLYVGTARNELCVQAYSENVVDSTYPYPPTDPNVTCPATGALLEPTLQAEIWAYDPVAQSWGSGPVYQPNNTVGLCPNGSSFEACPSGTTPTLYTSPDMGYRGMLVYQEPQGAPGCTTQGGCQVLYVGSCSTAMMNAGVPEGRLLRSTDGVTFTPVPQDAGTVFGQLGNACFRGMIQINGQMFIMAVNFKGQGQVLQSATPWAGDNSFQPVTALNNPAYEIAQFNNNLYVTFVNRNTGFSVAYTNPAGSYPYNWTYVIQQGGYLTPYANPIALSMQVFNGSLYVGGDGVRNSVPLKDTGAELFRINPDNSWDLIAGKSRCAAAGNPSPCPSGDYKSSLSGLTAGFDWTLNEHIWRMAIYDGRLYCGTFDESTQLRNNPKVGSTLAPEYGFDLWWSQDGTYFTQTDQQGFEDEYNIGVRSLMATPTLSQGLFLGSANPFYGLKIYQGTTTVADGTRSAKLHSAAEPPQHVQIEQSATGALLSWDAPASGASMYHIFRRTYQPTDSSRGAIMAPSSFHEIGTTNKLTYKDASAVATAKYSYEIKSDNGGNLSGPSNTVIYPSEAAPVTFSEVQSLVNGYAQNGKFTSAAAQLEFQTGLLDAQAAADDNQFDKLEDLRASVKENGDHYFNDSTATRDSELMLSRLQKRAQLVKADYLPPEALSKKPVNPVQQAGTATPPAQPSTGPGGNSYPYGSVTANGPYWANNRYTNNNVKYYIYEPGTPAPATAPVILFLHGYGALTTDYYQAWINHMVMKGYIVVWPKYQAQVTSTFMDYPSNAQEAWTDALYRLQNFTWEQHVRPAIGAHGSPQTIIVGHSFGGWITAWLAGQASTSVPAFPAPEALVMIEPASLGLLPTPNWAGISSNTTMLFVSADQDNVACSANAVQIFESTTQVPNTQKNYLFFNTDSYGTPAQLGNHFFPDTNGYKDDNQFAPYNGVDARDYYVTWKLSVAAANCTFSGTDCDYFLGSGSANQLGMGSWSDGTVETPMSYYADPTQLPPITGCAATKQ